MRLDIFCMSDTGCVRSGNQDMAAAGLNLIRDGQTGFTRTIGEADNFLLLVADGMGGHQHGEMASSYALEELRAVILDRDRDWSDPGRLLTEEALRISTELNLKSAGMQLEKPMGCTLTGFVWAGGRTLLVNVGDSRSYRLRGGMLRRLTQDQTLHERDMVPLPAGKAIYSCLGGGISPETVIQDYGDKLLPGDRLLICVSRKVKDLAKLIRPWDTASYPFMPYRDDPCIATDSLVGWYDVTTGTFTELELPKARLMPTIHNDDATTKSFYYVSSSNIDGMRPQELSLIPKKYTRCA